MIVAVKTVTSATRRTGTRSSPFIGLIATQTRNKMNDGDINTKSHNELFTSALHALRTLVKIEVTIKKRQSQSFKLSTRNLKAKLVGDGRVLDDFHRVALELLVKMTMLVVATQLGLTRLVQWARSIQGLFLLTPVPQQLS